MLKVYVQIAVETEVRADRWACRSPEFGFVVYGKTREAARKEVNKALTALLSGFHGDLDAIDRFLQKRKVQYYNIDGTPSDVPFVPHAIAAHHQGTTVEVSLEEVSVA